MEIDENDDNVIKKLLQRQQLQRQHVLSITQPTTAILTKINAIDEQHKFTINIGYVSPLQKFQLHRDVRQKKQLLKELRHEIPQLIANGNTLLVSKSKINYKFLANTLASIQHLLFLLNLFHEMKMVESLIEKIEQILKRKTKKNN